MSGTLKETPETASRRLECFVGDPRGSHRKLRGSYEGGECLGLMDSAAIIPLKGIQRARVA